MSATPAATAMSVVVRVSPPKTSAFSVMIADGRKYLREAWWFSTFPGIAILLTVLAFNLLGDGLRDVMDPRARRRF
jgi:peptide/nickel transport system permease protein